MLQGTTERLALLDKLLFASLVLLALSAPFSIAISQNALGLAYLLTGWRALWGVRPVKTGVEPFALLFVLWALLSIPFSQNPMQSLHHANKFLLLPSLWFFATSVDSEKRRATVFVAMALGAAGVGIYGVWQYFQGPGGLSGRVYLTQGYMTGAGLMMLVGLTILAFLLKGQGKKLRLFAALALLPVLAALVFTLTRSAWLGFFAGALLLLSLARPRLLPVFLIALALGIVLSPESFRDRLRSAFDPSHEHNRERVEMWRTGLRILRDNPLTGVGDTDLREVYRSYHAGEDRQIHGHLHSNYAMFAAIWGGPGFALAMLWLFALAWRLLRAWRDWRRSTRAGDRAPPLAGAWILAALAGWLGFMVAGLFEWNFGDSEIVLLLWSLCGLGFSWRKDSPQEQPA